MWLKDDLDRMFNTDRYERIFYNDNDNEIIFIICEGKCDVFAIKNNINVKERYFDIIEKLIGKSIPTNNEKKEIIKSYVQNISENMTYACMEHMNCGCSNPFHTIFETHSKEEAENWVNKSPDKRKYIGYDK
jgi:hypothetical protein